MFRFLPNACLVEPCFYETASGVSLAPHLVDRNVADKRSYSPLLDRDCDGLSNQNAAQRPSIVPEDKARMPFESVHALNFLDPRRVPMTSPKSLSVPSHQQNLLARRPKLSRIRLGARIVRPSNL